MFHTSHTNRLAATCVGSGVIALLALGATSALGDDTETDETAGVDIGYAKHGNVEAQTDAPHDPPANWRRLLNEIDTPLQSTQTREVPRTDRSDACPPPPDVRVAGVPWVPAVETECASLDQRRRFVEVAEGECVFDQRYLPHTADAVDGWYHNCRSRQ